MHTIRIQGPRPLQLPSPAAGLGLAARTYRDPPGRRAHGGDPSAARRSGPPPPPALRLLAPRPGLRLALAAALAVRGWAREETEPPRAPRAASGAARPPSGPSLSPLRGERGRSALGSRALCSTPPGRRGDAGCRLLGDFSAVGTGVRICRRARTKRRNHTGFLHAFLGLEETSVVSGKCTTFDFGRPQSRSPVPSCCHENHQLPRPAAWVSSWEFSLC
ncbi:uncharacterized protein [Odocoileus virginianus]|uniref:Uncharacterized protein isoform X2 n=1 Tax=Odocoileus virginianus TaxID=9874 RepID=A0ABM4J9D0_ODOVR